MIRLVPTNQIAPSLVFICHMPNVLPTCDGRLETRLHAPVSAQKAKGEAGIVLELFIFFFVGDELFSDTYPMRLVDDIFYEVDGKVCVCVGTYTHVCVHTWRPGGVVVKISNFQPHGWEFYTTRGRKNMKKMWKRNVGNFPPSLQFTQL